ncbi:NAC domain-containing protein 91-like [Tripterygium wilfordii]|uniref:NAC domain-containing protein 91-like n=1 Tax=Tripterygium wilfordii TaxID=458696 RepID=UPI0018F7F47B|nr:NAC domain-containing protein 91-like [Tripterygium wilfordii]
MTITSSQVTSANDMGNPGFRFNPTDEQLVNYYLRYKICGNDNEVSAIGEIDNICNYERWDLPMLAAIPSQDTWYFFSPPDRKYRKSGNNNRVTRAGFWKVTGKKREIKNRRNQVIGFKSTLVFYRGRLRDPAWTNWTIHEYQLNSSCFNGRDYIISRLHRKQRRRAVNSVVDEVENTLADMTLADV